MATEIPKELRVRFSPSVCKFCKQATWYDVANSRHHNDGGEGFHADSCERRKAFFKNEAAQRAQGQRDARRPL